MQANFFQKSQLPPRDTSRQLGRYSTCTALGSAVWGDMEGEEKILYDVLIPYEWQEIADHSSGLVRNEVTIDLLDT